jgi:ribosomal-protein-alanine N-acetyltransferase
VAAASRRIQVTLFRRADLRSVLKIESDAFGDEAYQRELFLELQQECGDLFFVARYSGLIAGYAVSCARGEKAEIASIAVDPKYRNKGLGRALMLRTLNKLKTLGVRTAELMVRSTSVATIRFYRNLGFSRVRKVAHYYQDGGDAWRMKKIL